MFRAIKNKVRGMKKKSPQTGSQTRRRRVSRRRFLVGAAGATAVALGGGALVGKITEYNAARIRKITESRENKAKLFETKDIKNPAKWAELSEYGNLDPLGNKQHAAFVSRINKIAGAEGISPERALFTLQQPGAFSTSEPGTRANPMQNVGRESIGKKINNAKAQGNLQEAERLTRVLNIYQTMSELPTAERNATFGMASKISKEKVKAMVERTR
jgi:hypothetical protein